MVHENEWDFAMMCIHNIHIHTQRAQAGRSAVVIGFWLLFLFLVGGRAHNWCTFRLFCSANLIAKTPSIFILFVGVRVRVCVCEW